MLEFKKLCDEFEALSPVERGLLLTEQSVVVLAKLHALGFPLGDPSAILAGFVVGSVTADGKINEQEYLMIYPALVRVFGDDFDFASVKEAFHRDREGRRAVAAYTEAMMSLLHALDDSLKEEVLLLCLAIVSIDGHVSRREKRYIQRLFAAA